MPRTRYEYAVFGVKPVLVKLVTFAFTVPISVYVTAELSRRSILKESSLFE